MLETILITNSRKMYKIFESNCTTGGKQISKYLFIKLYTAGKKIIVFNRLNREYKFFGVIVSS